MSDEGVVITDENEKPYKVHLCKTDISQNSNKFYDMELLKKHDKGPQKFAVKLINGRIGYKGVTNFKCFGDLGKAKTFFEKKFHDKTHLEWDNRNDEPYPGKYVVVELAKKDNSVKKEDVEEGACDVKKEVVEQEEKQKKTRGSKKALKREPEPTIVEFPNEIKSLLKIICDEDIHLGMLKQLKFNEEYGKPIDCLSLSQLEQGYQILMEIEKIVMPNVEVKKTRARKMDMKKVVTSGSITHDSNKYYSLIPHSFGFSVPPRIDTLNKVKQEIELLDALKGTIEAAQSLKDAKMSGSPKDIYHRLYDRLPCKIEPVDPETSEIIGECLKFRAPTHYWKTSLVNSFEIKHEHEEPVVKTKRRKLRQNGEKLLLWHGTRVTNVFSILMNGLEIPEGPRGDLMFGNGVYFANVPSKSVNYCKPEVDSTIFLLLCEVDVENSLILYASDSASREKVKDEKKGLVYAAGKQTPKETVEINGVPIYKGGLEEIDKDSELLYDEYVVYEQEKFKIKYIAEVKVSKMSLDEMMDD